MRPPCVGSFLACDSAGTLHFASALADQEAFRAGKVFIAGDLKRADQHSRRNRLDAPAREQLDELVEVIRIRVELLIVCSADKLMNQEKRRISSALLSFNQRSRHCGEKLVSQGPRAFIGCNAQHTAAQERESLRHSATGVAGQALRHMLACNLAERLIGLGFDACQSYTAGRSSPKDEVCIAALTTTMVKDSNPLRLAFLEDDVAGLLVGLKKEHQFRGNAWLTSYREPRFGEFLGASAVHPLLHPLFGWRVCKPVVNGTYLSALTESKHSANSLFAVTKARVARVTR